MDTVVVDFKVKMRTGGKTGQANFANLVTGVNNLTKDDLEALEVGVDGEKAVAVIKN